MDEDTKARIAAGPLLGSLCENIGRATAAKYIDYDEFLAMLSSRPLHLLRDVFQHFADAVRYFVGEGKDEYPDDPESVQFVEYDCSRLFVRGHNQPFFADRLFANEFVKRAESFRQGGIFQNQIYCFIGPPGCGKSIFLDNLVGSLEDFSRSAEGLRYEIVWKIPAPESPEYGGMTEKLACLLDELVSQKQNGKKSGPAALEAAKNRSSLITGSGDPCKSSGYFYVPCPSHDNPILIIPKSERRAFLQKALREGDDVVDFLGGKWTWSSIKNAILNAPDFKWIYEQDPCTICSSMFSAFHQMYQDPGSVFSLICARPYIYNRRTSNGVVVFGADDKPVLNEFISNPAIQSRLNAVLKDSNAVHYIYTILAKTNQGVYAIMDAKNHNVERFVSLHGRVTEGTYKVGDSDQVEEKGTSLFLVIMNPEDKEYLLPDAEPPKTEAPASRREKNAPKGAPKIVFKESFRDRVTYHNCGYLRDYKSEIELLKFKIGADIERKFMPRVLEIFTKLVVATRLKTASSTVENWISESTARSNYGFFASVREYVRAIKLDVYAGVIPPWLTEEDKRSFNQLRRKNLLNEGRTEGDSGISGRDADKLFSDFMTKYFQKMKKKIDDAKGDSPEQKKLEERLVSITDVIAFFTLWRKQANSKNSEFLSDDIIVMMRQIYQWHILREIKEALYFFNEERLRRDTINYLYALSFDSGERVVCPVTGDSFEVGSEFFNSYEKCFGASNSDDKFWKEWRKKCQSNYLTEIITQGVPIEESVLFDQCIEAYRSGVKENVMDPFVKNENFRRALDDYGTSNFDAYDTRIKEDIERMISKMAAFGYSARGALDTCAYVIDEKLVEKFSKKRR